ncbi:MAG: TraR/DksA family transcriptional regulator [Actinomycetota bacterium]|nr:TraR/DksA family transcriptional regulator [Actinomycetota bacterium]
MNKIAIRRRLIEQQKRLLSIRDAVSLETLADGSQAESVGDPSGADQHMADAGTETFEREKDYSILSGVEAELADVERALRRLSEGTYGTCEACGRPIGMARLEARPATRFCIEDQSRVEREVRTA